MKIKYSSFGICLRMLSRWAWSVELGLQPILTCECPCMRRLLNCSSGRAIIQSMKRNNSKISFFLYFASYNALNISVFQRRRSIGDLRVSIPFRCVLTTIENTYSTQVNSTVENIIKVYEESQIKTFDFLQKVKLLNNVILGFIIISILFQF